MIQSLSLEQFIYWFLKAYHPHCFGYPLHTSDKKDVGDESTRPHGNVRYGKHYADSPPQ